MTPDFKNVQTLNLYLNDFKQCTSESVQALVEERALFISSDDFSHPLADDCFIIAMHWPDIVDCSKWVCERIVKDLVYDDARLTFDDWAQASLRMKLMQLLIEATDVNNNAADLCEYYKCSANELGKVMNLVKSISMSCGGNLNHEHINNKRVAVSGTGIEKGAPSRT